VRRPSPTENECGDLEFADQAVSDEVRSTGITSLVTIGNTAIIAGTCMNKGVPCTFAVNVTDSGPLGAGDIFTIAISGGPVRGGTLQSGKILVPSNHVSTASQQCCTGVCDTTTSTCACSQPDGACATNGDCCGSATCDPTTFTCTAACGGAGTLCTSDSDCCTTPIFLVCSPITMTCSTPA